MQGQDAEQDCCPGPTGYPKCECGYQRTTVFGIVGGLGGYDAMLSPMSLALGWGLAFSTLITLFLVPALYTIAGDLRRAIASKRQLAVSRIKARSERETATRL